MAGAEWLNRYVSLEKESTFGTEPSGTQVFGEVEGHHVHDSIVISLKPMTKPAAATNPST